jgi:hypothetical protein
MTEPASTDSETMSKPASDTLDAWMWNIVRLSQSMLLAASFWYSTRADDQYGCTMRVKGATRLEVAIALAIARSALGAVGNQGKAPYYSLDAQTEDKNEQPLTDLKEALLAWSKSPQEFPSRALSLATITMALYMCQTK